MYSTDAAVDPSLPSAQASAPSRDSTIPGLFGLRRSTKQDQAAEAQRRMNISGPYNFQHVAHTQKDKARDAQPPANRTTLASEFAQLRGSHAPAHGGGRKGARPDDLHFADFSSDSLPLNEEDMAPLELQKTTSLTRTPSVLKKHPSSRRLLNRSQSQEQLNMGIPPPRPPRSPI
jgi:hypothetical protein